MSAESISGTVQFLKFMRRGHDPQELVQSVWEERSQEIDGHFHRVIVSLILRQEEIEKELGSLVDRVAALDITTTAQKKCAASQNQVAELQAEQKQLQEVLAKTQIALKARGQNIGELNRGFQELHKRVNKLPSAYEAPLLELGHKASNFIQTQKIP